MAPRRVGARVTRVTVDGNEAAASVAYRLSEVLLRSTDHAVSPMGERPTSGRAAAAEPWGAVPGVVEMQSEAARPGAMHGALQGGALATTFTPARACC